MGRFVAFLRGMNLGRRRIKNPELCACFEELGFENVSAFLASGNVIFDAGSGAPTQVAKRIEAGLREALGYEVPTFLRTAREVRAIAAHAPFPATVVAKSKGKPQVAMLARKPTANSRKAVLQMATADDRLAIEAKELHWLPVGKITESELDLKAIETVLGSMTIRTRNTVDRIAAKYLAT